MKPFPYILLLFLTLFISSCGQEEKPEKAIQLSYVNFTPATTFVSVQMNRWAEEVELRTQGRVKINLLPTEGLLNATAIYDGVIEGKTDIGNLCTAYQPGRFPLTNALSLPLGFPNAKMASKAMIELFNTFTYPEFDDVEVLTLFANAPANIMSTTPIRTLKNIKGMNLRGSGGAANVLKSWGAHQAEIPMSEVPEAFNQGRIEGVFTSLDVMNDYNIADKCKYITMTEQVVYPFAVVMNKEKFNGLPEDIQNIFRELFTDQSEWTANYIDNRVKETVEWAVREQGVEVLTPTKREKARMDQATSSLIGNWAAEGVLQGVPTEEILATLQDFTEEEL